MDQAEWVADPVIAWRILLAATTTGPLDPAVVAQRQVALHADQGWSAPPPVATGPADTVRATLAEVRGEPLVVGVDGDRLVVSAFHAYVDGLGLLEVLAALTGAAATSSTRGVAERPPAESVARAGLDRLGEVAFAPPARVALTPVAAADGDAYAAVEVPQRVRTAELVRASVAGLVAHNTSAGTPARHVAVSIGAGRPAVEGEGIGNRSELIRLRDLEGRSLPEVEAALRSTPLSGAGGSGAAGGRLTRVALRAMAPRLGSTLLVSHLGEVTTEGAGDLAFYPVTAGGTGLSLGAVGQDGRTTLTLRGRARSWDAAGLSGLLDRVAAELT